MENKKKLTTGLAEKQELQRQETIDKVLRACADIKAEGIGVTISALVEYTGLSRSTFSKPHIRELLTEYRYSSDDNLVATAKRKRIKQSEIFTEKDRLIAELRTKNEALEKECALLRAKIFCFDVSKV